MAVLAGIVVTFMPGVGLLTGPIGVMCCNRALQDKEHVTGIIKTLTLMAFVMGTVLTLMHYSQLLKSFGT